jgi:hypothetical protein
MILEIIIFGLIILGIILTVYDFDRVPDESLIEESKRRYEEYIATKERFEQRMKVEVIMERLNKKFGDQNGKKY